MVLSGPGCELVRGEAAAARAGPVAVVVVPPGIDDPSRHEQAPEHVLIEAFVAEAAVEALDEGVLDRLAPAGAPCGIGLPVC